MTLEKYGREEIIKRLTKEIAKSRDEEKWKECRTEKKEKWASLKMKAEFPCETLISVSKTTGHPARS
jgi:hypothetical protein